jgi:UPF0716 protein FxsA
MRRSALGPLIFIGYPALEIVVAIWVASLIGWAWTVALLLVGLGAGFAVMRIAGITAFKALSDPIAQAQAFERVNPETGERVVIYPNHELSPEEVAVAGKQLRSSGLLFAGGGLLAMPGFITDVLALVLVFPPTRTVVASRMASRSEARGGVVVQGETVVIDEHGVRTESWSSGTPEAKPSPTKPPDVIQGEILPPKPREPEDQ